MRQYGITNYYIHDKKLYKYIPDAIAIDNKVYIKKHKDRQGRYNWTYTPPSSSVLSSSSSPKTIRKRLPVLDEPQFYEFHPIDPRQGFYAYRNTLYQLSPPLSHTTYFIYDNKVYQLMKPYDTRNEYRIYINGQYQWISKTAIEHYED